MKLRRKQYGLEDYKARTSGLLQTKDAAAFIGRTVAGLYQLTCANDIPFIKKGKMLYFCPDNLKEWLLSGRQKTKAEINADVDRQIKANKRKRQ